MNVLLRGAWRQSTGEKDLAVSLTAVNQSSAVVLVDGIYLLHPEIRAHLDRILLIEDTAVSARAKAEGRDAHRAETPYLGFKAHLAEKFDAPYFAKYRAFADVSVTVTTPAL
jgi:hypothetical protein